MNLQIEEAKHSAKETMLIVKGEIDVYTAPELREKLLAACAEKQHKVVVDLSGVTYMDSTGLGIFIGAYKASLGSEGAFTLTGLTPRVERLFKITGIDELITIERFRDREGE